MIRVGLVANPRSRRYMKRGAKARLESLIGEYDRKVKVILREADDDPSPEAYDAALEEFEDRDVHLLGYLSGDGEMSMGMTQMFNRSPNGSGFPIIFSARGGTVNVQANAAGLPDRTLYDSVFGEETITEFTLRKVLDECARHQSDEELETVDRTLVHVHAREGNDRNGKDVYGFSFSTGIASNFLRAYEELGWGQPAAFFLMARAIFDPSFRKRMLEVPHIHVTARNNHQVYDYGEGNFNLLIANSMDVTMNLGLWELNQPMIQGINDKEAIRLLTSQDVSILDLLREVFSGRIIKKKGKEGIDLQIPDIVPRDIYGKVTLEPRGRLSYMVDADPYQTEGLVELSTTRPIPYLTLS